MEAHSSNPPKRDMHPKQSATAMAKGAAKPNRFRRNFVYSIVFGGCCIFLPFLASNTASARYINTPTILFITSIFLFYNSGIRTAIISTFVGRRIQDEAVPPGHQRVFWINSHGKVRYDDYFEHEPGALRALQEYLGTAIRRPSMPSASRTYQTSSVTEQTDDGTSSSQNTKTGESSTRTLHLLSAIEKGRSSIELHQDIVTHITDDRQLFHHLRRSYDKHRGTFRRYWSLRTVQSIRFAKFAYTRARNVDVQHHEDICAAGKPRTCIPPATIVLPTGSEYAYNPVPAPLCPPVGPHLLTDFFADPDGIEEGSTFILHRIPKRAYGPLQLQPRDDGGTEAWGICYRESWDWDRLGWVLDTAFLPPSLVVGTLWAVLRNDVSGAFGVAWWWMAGATGVVGVVGMCSWAL